MSENKDFGREFNSPLELLRHTVSEFHRLEAEAQQALIGEKNAANVQTKLTQRAQLLVDLPGKMSQLVEEKQSHLDEESMIKLQQFAHMAEDRIQSGDYFGLSTLLINKGHKKGEPNALDELIEEIS